MSLTTSAILASSTANAVYVAVEKHPEYGWVILTVELIMIAWFMWKTRLR